VLGDGVSDTMGGEIRGTAPGAQLILQSTLDPEGNLGGIPIDLRYLFEPPYSDGARVHTNSWGNVRPGLPYDASAWEIDATVWANPDLVICFAAGNDGIDRNANGVIDAGSVGSEAAAKNCVTVGASESVRSTYPSTYGGLWPGDYPAPPVSSDRLADDADGMVAFSSRGPTRESRIKPDIVAPGSCILSTRSRDLVVAPTKYGESSDPAFFFNSGTSMATPLVARERHGNSGTSTRFDRVNNVEQVSWAGIPAGTVRVVVRAFRITRFPQPYAVAWHLNSEDR